MGLLRWARTELLVLLQSIRKGLRDQGKDLAAAIAFWAFFSIFPLLLGISSAVAYLFDSDLAQQQLLEVLHRSLPGSAELVQHTLASVMSTRGTLGVIGILGLFWTGSSAFGAITRTVDRAIGATRRRRLVVSRLFYLGMAVAAAGLLVLSAVSTALIEILTSHDERFLARLGLDQGLVSRLLGPVAGVVFGLITFALIFKFAPSVKVRWRQILPGAVLGAVIFELGKRGFLLYLGRATRFEAIYGSLSSIVVLLLWLYLSALVLVLAAEYNIVRWQVRRPQDVLTTEARD